MAHSGGAGNSGTSNQKALPRGVLARSGLPLPAGARLSSSIRAPRDLTLGGKVGGLPKKSLAPNLTPKSSTSTSAANNSEGRGNVRRRFGPRGEDGEYCGRGYRDGSGTRRRGGADSSRGRGRGKGVHQNLVQLDGIFEANPTVLGNSWSTGAGVGKSGGSSTSVCKDSSLPKYIPIPQEDCENTDETINRLTRANFVDYGDDNDECELPLMIPLTTARYGTTCKVEDYTSLDDAVRTLHDEDNNDDSGSQDFAMDIDGSEGKKPLKVEKPDLEADPSVVARNLLSTLCLGHGAAEADDEGKTVTVFQLPRLPGPSKASQEEERRVLPKDSKNSKTQNEISQQYQLKNLSKGYLGRLQVLRDGRVRMISGRVVMELQMVSELPLYQELVEVQGRMMLSLAKVENKVVCRLNPNDLVGQDSGTNSSSVV